MNSRNINAKPASAASEAPTTSETDALKLDHQLCFAMYACSREITKLYQPLLKAMNLTYTQFLTMLVLWEADGIPVKELGARLYLDSGTLTPLLKKLESAGLVTRTRDRSDERSVLIALTDKGVAIREQGLAVPDQVFQQTTLHPDKLIQLYQLSRELLFDLKGSDR